jgi:hypothetical protein
MGLPHLFKGKPGLPGQPFNQASFRISESLELPRKKGKEIIRIFPIEIYPYMWYIINYRTFLRRMR